MGLAPGIAEALVDIVGPEHVRLAPHERALYARDALGFFRVVPDAVVFPATTTEVADVMRGASSCGIPVGQRSANAGACTAPVLYSGGIVLALDRMNQVLEIRPERCLARVQPRVTAARLAEAATAAGLFYDSGSEDAIGGVHELSPDRLVAIEAVSPSGEIVYAGRGQTGRHDGFGPRRLVASPGGNVITGAILELTPEPARECVEVAYFATVADACRAMRSILASGRLPAVFEFLDRACISALNDSAQLGLRQDAGALLLYAESGVDAAARENISRIGQICLAVGALELARADQCQALLAAMSRMCALTTTEQDVGAGLHSALAHDRIGEDQMPWVRRIRSTLGGCGRRENTSSPAVTSGRKAPRQGERGASVTR